MNIKLLEAGICYIKKTNYKHMNLTYFCRGNPENSINNFPAISLKGKNTDLF